MNTSESLDSPSWAYVPLKRLRRPGDEFFEEGDLVCAQLAKHVVEDEAHSSDFCSTDDRADNMNSTEELSRNLADFQVREITCEVKGCSAEFSSLRAYEHHYKSLHKVRCRFCNRNFPTNYLLDLHVTENHDSLFATRVKRGELMYLCILKSCDSKFRTKDERMNHLVEMHCYPSDFRFLKERKHPEKSKKPKKPDIKTSEKNSKNKGSACTNDMEENDSSVCNTTENMTETNDFVMEVDSPKSSQEQTAENQFAGRIKSRGAPKTICFGRGAGRGFHRTGLSKSKNVKQKMVSDT